MKTGNFFFLLLLMFALTLAGCGNDQSGTVSSSNQASGKTAEKIVIKASHNDPVSSPRHLAFERFAEIVGEESDGNIEVEIYPSGQLSNGDNTTMIQQLQSGTLQMTSVSNIVFSSFEQKFGAISLPFLFDNRQEAYDLVDGPIGEELLSLLEPQGIQGIGYWEGGFRQITNSERAVKKPQDLEGLKIRVPEINMYVSLYKKFGASPTPMAFGELFSALEQGVVDGQENPLVTIDSAKFQEVQEHVTIWDYSWDALIIGMNKKFWDGLDSETQKIITDAVNEAGQYERNLVAKGDEELVAKLEEYGMTVTKLTPEELKAFREIANQVYEDVEPDYTKELIDKILEAVK